LRVGCQFVKGLTVLALSALAVFLLFVWQGTKGLNLGDEGFLWYGAQRVLEGEVPIRDFQSYDPGRYYWSASLMGLLNGSGIMNLRVAVAIFQVLGLFAALMLLARSNKKYNWLFLFVSTGILLAWMFPRHKLFDISISILLVTALTFLLENPSVRRQFVTGLCIGFVAVFGRNHGVYGIVGYAGVMIWLCLDRDFRWRFTEHALSFGVGIIVGFLPIVLLCMIYPGFFQAFWESILYLFDVNATNLTLPIPWPWQVDFDAQGTLEAWRAVLVGLAFIALVLFSASSIIWVFVRKFCNKPVSSVLVAAAFLSLPYAHYAYSRADVPHLGQAIFPLLIGVLVMSAERSTFVKWSLMLVLSGVSLFIMLPVHPAWQCEFRVECRVVKVSGSSLEVDYGTAESVEHLQKLEQNHAPIGRAFYVTPLWPAAYAILERRSPTWEIYSLLPRSHEFQQEEIDRLREVSLGFALIIDAPLDGREDLRFKNNRATIYQYFEENFERVPNQQRSFYDLYKSKDN
jgi:hypothetical protein